jgi:hypothetical protein
MSQPGIGTMLHFLGGGSEKNASDYYGRKITAVFTSTGPGYRSVGECEKEALNITFDDGVTIRLTDEGQSCCEHRFMTCDDDLSKLVGGHLRKIEVRELKEETVEYGDHEQAFVEIATDECFITVVTHNEHNGYYGGFGLSIGEVPRG